MKKMLSSGMGMCIFVASAFGFSACSEQEEGHIHDFTGEFIEVDGGHVRKCTGEDCNEVSGTVQEHGWVADDGKENIDATCHSDGAEYFKCSDCGAKKSQTITQRPDHSFTGEWVNTDPDGHYRICINDGCDAEEVKAEHDMKDVQEITPPQGSADGVMKTACSVCGYESTRPILATHTQGETLKYEAGGATHWYSCADHEDCGKKFDEANHSFETQLENEGKDATCLKDGYTVWQCACGATENRTVSKDTVPHNYEGQSYVSDGEGGHHIDCTVCGTALTSGHEYSETVTLQPTLWTAGEKTFTCDDCGHTKTEELPKAISTNYKQDFSLESNPNGSWSYGTVDYQWGEKEDFTFTHLTEKTEEAWKKNDLEIKDGFINANGAWAVVAFTFKEAISAEIDFSFVGTIPMDGEGNRLTDDSGNLIPQAKFNCRIGVKDAAGIIYGNPEFRGGEVCEYKETKNFNVGDTVYFMIEHAGVGWTSGNLNINVTKVIEEA